MNRTKHQIIEEEQPEEESFYESMPAASQPIYREPLLVRDETDQASLSVWAVVGIILLGLILLLWFLGRGINLGTTQVNAPTTSTPSTAPSTNR